jgi:hypothetical protein
MQQNIKLLEDKNRMLLSQVVTIRRENTQKEKNQDSLEKKLAAADKSLVMYKINQEKAVLEQAGLS